MSLATPLLWALCAAPADLPPDAGYRAEEAVLSARNLITHGRLKIHYEWIDNPDAAQNVAVWFDYRKARRQRWDYETAPSRNIHADYGEMVLADPRARHVERLVVDGRQHLWWTPDVFDKPARIAVMIQDEDQAPQRKTIFDPLVIGLNDASFLQYWACNPKEFLTAPDRTQGRAFMTQLDGKDVICSEYVSPKEVKTQLWISPTEGNSLVRARTEQDYEGEPFVTELTVDVQPNSDKSLWFPRALKVDRRHGSREMLCEQMVLTEVVLNEEFDTRVFSLAGMDIPPGTSVLGEPEKEGKARIWDGQNVVDSLAPEDAPPSSPIRPDRSSTLLLVGVNVAAAAVLLLILWARRRSATTGR
jgi:hypothetical protein